MRNVGITVVVRWVWFEGGETIMDGGGLEGFLQKIFAPKIYMHDSRTGANGFVQA